MSLIRTRQRRKKQWLDARKGLPVRKLMALLVLVGLVIWYLDWRF